MDLFARLLCFSLQPLLRYSPCLLVTIIALLISTHFYPIHKDDFGCFPCRCQEKDDGAKHLANCHLVGVLRLKDVSLNKQSITSIAEDAFTSSRGLQRLSLWQSVVFFASKCVLPVGEPATLGPGPLGFATGGVRHVCRLVKLENLVPQPKSFEGAARRFAAPHASSAAIAVWG